MQAVGRQRPRGITIISIVLWILGILAVIGSIGSIVLVNAAVHSAALDTIATVILIISAILGIAEIVLGWGLWTLKPWAFWATVVVEALIVIVELYNVIAVHNNLGLFYLILGLVILIYLFADRNVRAAFRT